MAYNRSQVQRLLTEQELALFASSLADQITGMTKAELRRKVAQARRLRDKFQDLYQRQSLATRDRTRGLAGKAGAENARTDKKARIFAEVLARFEKRIETLDRAEARMALRGAAQQAMSAARVAAKPVPPSRRPNGSSLKQSPKKAGCKTGPVSPAARQAQVAQQVKGPRTKAVQGHVKARAKRAQAKKDRR